MISQLQFPAPPESFGLFSFAVTRPAQFHILPSIAAGFFLVLLESHLTSRGLPVVLHAAMPVRTLGLV